MTELFEDVSSLEDCVEKVKTSSIGANALKYVEDAWECTAVAGATRIETHENDPFQITKSCVFQGKYFLLKKYMRTRTIFSSSIEKDL